MRRFSFAGAILSLIYLVALIVAGNFLLQTLALAQTLPAIQARALATGTPTIAPTSAPLIIPPSPVPPTPLPTAEPPEAAPVSYHPKSGRLITVWLPPTFQGGARESFFANTDIIDDISPFWYSTDASGRIYGTRNAELVRIAHEHNVRIIPSLHNVTDNPNVAATVLRNPALRARHIESIVGPVMVSLPAPPTSVSK